jgi:hypothetical protein
LQQGSEGMCRVIYELACDELGDQPLGEAVVRSTSKATLRREGADYQGMTLHYRTLNRLLT